jgi:hypothetical protein
MTIREGGFELCSSRRWNHARCSARESSHLPPAADIAASSALRAGASVKTTAGAASAKHTLVNLTVQPLDLNLLGLEVTSSPITITVKSQPGPGRLIGGLLDYLIGIGSLGAMNDAANQVLSATAQLANGGQLEHRRCRHGGALGSPAIANADNTVLTLTVPACRWTRWGRRCRSARSSSPFVRIPARVWCSATRCSACPTRSTRRCPVSWTPTSSTASSPTF